MNSLLADLRWYLERKDALLYLVSSQLELSKKGTALGNLWWILEPLLLMATYWVLVSTILGRGGPDYPLFLLCGLIPFRAFALSFNQSVGSLVSSFSIISQVNFPRIFLCLAGPLANHVKLVFAFSVVLAGALLYDRDLGLKTFYLAIPFAAQLVLVSGLGLIFSILCVYIRDIQFIMASVIRLLTYCSPILYGIDQVPERFRWLILLNPLGPIITTYRDVIMNRGAVNIDLVLLSLIQATGVFLLGYLVFVLNEKKILKRI